MSAPPTVPPLSEGARLRHLRRTAWGMVGVLALQNLVGIYVNLYVSLPLPANYGAVLDVVVGSPVLALHAILALLLLAGSLEMLGTAWGLSNEIRLPAASAVLWTLLAIVMGYEFVDDPGNLESFLMELAFVGVVLSEVVLLYRATVRTAGAPTGPGPGAGPA